MAPGRDRGGIDAVPHLLDLWGILSPYLPSPGAGHLPVNHYGVSGRPTLSALARRQSRAPGAPGLPGLAADRRRPHDAGLRHQDLDSLLPDSPPYLDGDSPRGPGDSALTGLLELAVAAAARPQQPHRVYCRGGGPGTPPSEKRGGDSLARDAPPGVFRRPCYGGSPPGSPQLSGAGHPGRHEGVRAATAGRHGLSGTTPAGRKPRPNGGGSPPGHHRLGLLCAGRLHFLPALRQPDRFAGHTAHRLVGNPLLRSERLAEAGRRPGAGQSDPDTGVSATRLDWPGGEIDVPGPHNLPATALWPGWF